MHIFEEAVTLCLDLPAQSVWRRNAQIALVFQTLLKNLNYAHKT